MQYIPYSERFKIEDENLSKLFNYLERVMAWDLYTPEDHIDGGFLDIKGRNGLRINRISGTVSISFYNERILSPDLIFSEMKEEVFFESFTTLLPLATNYAKKVLNG